MPIDVGKAALLMHAVGRSNLWHSESSPVLRQLSLQDISIVNNQCFRLMSRQVWGEIKWGK